MQLMASASDAASHKRELRSSTNGVKIDSNGNIDPSEEEARRLMEEIESMEDSQEEEAATNLAMAMRATRAAQRTRDRLTDIPNEAKRPRKRRKLEEDSSDEMPTTQHGRRGGRSMATTAPAAGMPAKRKVGRPMKHPHMYSPDGQRLYRRTGRPRGRPRIHPLPDATVETNNNHNFNRGENGDDEMPADYGPLEDRDVVQTDGDGSSITPPASIARLAQSQVAQRAAVPMSSAGRPRRGRIGSAPSAPSVDESEDMDIDSANPSDSSQTDIIPVDMNLKQTSNRKRARDSMTWSPNSTKATEEEDDLSEESRKNHPPGRSEAVEAPTTIPIVSSLWRFPNVLSNIARSLGFVPNE